MKGRRMMVLGERIKFKGIEQDSKTQNILEEILIYANLLADESNNKSIVNAYQKAKKKLVILR